ncbi:MAG: MerR family transcriptional regulator [Paracoccaceae bacterium]
MTKSADAFRTISEVADWLDTPTHVLRFWESKFSQIKPVKRAGGRRYYRPQDMLLIGGIKKLLHHDGLTIKGAQKILREHGQKYVCSLSQPLDVTKVPSEEVTLTRPSGDERVNKKQSGGAELDWKPMGLTSIAKDLGPEGQMIEPDPKERELPDVALEKLHALEKTEEGVYETDIAALLPDNESNLSIALDEGAVEDALSAVEEQKDQGAAATETASTISEKPTTFAKKAKKKSASLLDDDQPMLNFWADDEVEQDAGNADTLDDAVDQRDELLEDGDIGAFRSAAEFADAVPVDEVSEQRSSPTDAESEQDIDAASRDVGEQDDGSEHMRVIQTARDASVDTVAQNRKVLPNRVSIENHLASTPSLSPLKSKVLKTSLSNLEKAIRNRRSKL